MKIKRLCLGSVLFVFLFVSQGSAETSSPTQAISIRYAKGFTIEYQENSKILTVLNPWQDADVTYQYLLVQRGTVPPAGHEHVPRIDVPVRSVITLSTTHLAYLNQLNLLDTLVGYSTFEHINTPEVLKRIADGQLQEIGGGPDLNLELVLALNPEVIMTYYTVGSPYDAHFKLLEANLKVVINAEYMETTPLGRIEWIKFLAAFFNKEQEAETIFNNIVNAYETMAAGTKNVAEKPTVLLNAPYDGNWWIPGGNNYLVEFLKDAGATYLWADDPSMGSHVLDFEAVYEKAADADYWLHPGQWKSLKDGLAIDERFAHFRAFQQGNVYNNNARVNEYGGNDYWESGLTRPDIVLADLIKIFHPELVPDHKFVYYQQLK
jgi:iron complex transport system substrate-binding protein